MKKFVLVSLLAMSAMSVWAQTSTNKFYSASSKGYWSADVGYPQFEGASCAQMNIMIARKARETFDAFVADCKKFFKDNPKRPNAEWQLTVTPTVLLAKNGVVSFKSLDFRYTGGAHPNTVISTQNYALKTGQYRTITLKDVLATTTTAEAFGKEAVLPELEKVKKARSASPVDGFNTAMLNDVGFTDKGLVFFFSHYEVGPYSEGSFEAKLDWSAIGVYLNPEGPAKPFLPAQLSRIFMDFVLDFSGVATLPEDAMLAYVVSPAGDSESAFATSMQFVSPRQYRATPAVQFLDPSRASEYDVCVEIRDRNVVLYRSEVIRTKTGTWSESKTVTFKKVG